jgi:septation ring formation regulator EzrA
VSNEEKIKHLLEEKQKYAQKLEHLYRNFRGVRHENAASEMQYTTIKVYESHLESITKELKELGVKD